MSNIHRVYGAIWLPVFLFSNDARVAVCRPLEGHRYEIDQDLELTDPQICSCRHRAAGPGRPVLAVHGRCDRHPNDH